MLPPPKSAGSDRTTKTFMTRNRLINVESTPTTVENASASHKSTGFTPRVVSRGKDAIAPVLSDVEFTVKKPTASPTVTPLIHNVEEAFEPQNYPQPQFPTNSYPQYSEPEYDQPVTSDYEMLKIKQQVNIH